MAKIRCSLIPITTWRMRNVHFPVHFPFAHARNAHARLFAHCWCVLLAFHLWCVLLAFSVCFLAMSSQISELDNKLKHIRKEYEEGWCIKFKLQVATLRPAQA